MIRVWAPEVSPSISQLPTCTSRRPRPTAATSDRADAPWDPRCSSTWRSTEHAPVSPTSQLPSLITKTSQLFGAAGPAADAGYHDPPPGGGRPPPMEHTDRPPQAPLGRRSPLRQRSTPTSGSHRPLGLVGGVTFNEGSGRRSRVHSS